MLQLSTCVAGKKHSSVISKSDARNFLHVYYEQGYMHIKEIVVARGTIIVVNAS